MHPLVTILTAVARKGLFGSPVKGDTAVMKEKAWRPEWEAAWSNGIPCQRAVDAGISVSPPLYPVQDPSPWSGDTHTRGVLLHFRQSNLETPFRPGDGANS